MSDFIKACQNLGISIIRQLQEGDRGSDYKVDVWLIRDSDGIFKVLKEHFDYRERLGIPNEDELYKYLPNLSFLPSYYGMSVINNKKYLRKSFVYGQLLSDYCTGPYTLSKEDSRLVLYQLSTNLNILCSLNFLLFDLRPENILLTNRDVRFFDLGLSNIVKGNKEIKSVVTHPRYTTPETVQYVCANKKSIVFQLGLIAHELLYGENPIHNSFITEWNYCVHNFIKPLIMKKEIKAKNPFIQRMLSYNINDRPSIEDCIAEFAQGASEHPFKRKIDFKLPAANVLFPARMGIPHRGHIEYMTALLDMGFKLIISIQRSYTLSYKDPIPKWLVMKMVAQSLLDKGYPKESFEFYLTPFYYSIQEMQMHFTMLPSKFDFVASSNTEMEKYFPSQKIITQKDVLGIEGIPFETRSWGEKIRKAVKDNDYKTFKEYAATGVEKILSFDEIKTMISKQSNLETYVYNSGNVKVKLIDSKESYTVTRYSNPEKCLGFEILNPYSKQTEIIRGGKECRLQYVKIQIIDGIQYILFQILN